MILYKSSVKIATQWRIGITYRTKIFPNIKVNLGGKKSVGIAIKKTIDIPKYIKKLNSNDLINSIQFKLFICF